MNTRPTPRLQTRIRRRQRGMTLLELLVVVALMSVVGFMALSQVGDDLSQARYQDTENRLLALRRAVVGYEEPVFNGQRLFSGYAADNGRLPLDEWGLRSLIAIDTVDGQLDPYGPQNPIFDATPTDGFNDGIDETALVGPGLQLFKGWRGPYLVARPGEKGIYRDGWGNRDPDENHDELDFGWFADLATDAADANMSIISWGRDGVPESAVPAETHYDEDIGIEISANDWMVPIGEGWRVKIHNGTAEPIILGAGSCLRASLLVYSNQPQNIDNKRWLRVTSTCVSPPSPLMGEESIDFENIGSCLTTGDDGDVNVVSFTDAKNPSEKRDGLCPSSFPVEFDDTDFIPQGRHLIVLVVDHDYSAKHDDVAGKDTLCKEECKSTMHAFKQVDFFSRTALPNVTLEIAP